MRSSPLFTLDKKMSLNFSMDGTEVRDKCPWDVPLKIRECPQGVPWEIEGRDTGCPSLGQNRDTRDTFEPKSHEVHGPNPNPNPNHKMTKNVPGRDKENNPNPKIALTLHKDLHHYHFPYNIIELFLLTLCTPVLECSWPCAVVLNSIFGNLQLGVFSHLSTTFIE